MADREARNYRTYADLERAVRAIARHFDSDVVVVIGSQAILLANPAAPEYLRRSNEIDVYPGNARAWEAEQAEDFAEASEEINGWFGEGSQFHESFGFYIDGVDDTTAILPKGWMARANRRAVRDGDRTITVIAPRTEDLIVSKLCALRQKDKDFIELMHEDDGLDFDLIRRRLDETDIDPELKQRALSFLHAVELRER